MSSLVRDYEYLKDLYEIYKLWKEYKNVISERKRIRPRSREISRGRVVESERRRKRTRNREIKTERNVYGYYKVTFLKLKETDRGQFFKHTRMDREMFEHLLSVCENLLVRTSIRVPICPESRLALTLLYLAQGVSFQSLAQSWKLGKETVRTIIYETCDALWESLSVNYVSEPNSAQLSAIGDEFLRSWDMPNCIGAIHGKHIALKSPNSVPEYVNAKRHHSIVLMVACDAKYTFTFVDVGAYGSQSDGGVFQASSFGSRILRHELPIPGPKNLPNSKRTLPHFFVADSAFPLHTNIMKPFSGANLSREQEIFNKRISRARSMIENSFGILVARWRILLTTLHMLPRNAKKVVLACVALHNFLQSNPASKNLYIPSNYVDWEDEDKNLHDGIWRMEVDTNIPPIAPSRNIHVYRRTQANNIRSELCTYVNNEGVKNKS